MVTEVVVDFLVDYKELFSPYWRNIAFYGGRYSGKSYHFGLALLLRGRQSRLRILCTREIQNTIKDSVHKLLKDIIDKYGFNEYEVTEKSIFNTITGTEFIFRGLRGNTQEIKSMEGIDICWVEEAQSVTESSLDILTPTIRKEGSQMLFSFNRFTELDPVYVKYVLNPPPNTFHKMVNFDVLARVGLLTEVIRLEIEHDRKTDPELYAYKWMGEPLAQPDDAVISRTKILNAMRREVDSEGQFEVGVDVARFGGDRTVLWKRKGLKTLEFRVYEKLRVPEVVQKVKDFVDPEKLSTIIKVDDTGVGGGVTDGLIAEGYNTVPVNNGENALKLDKYNNKASESWFHLQEIIDTIQLPESQELLQELSNRLWKRDTKSRRCVESKENYKDRTKSRSPDLADACILAYYNVGVIMTKRSEEEQSLDKGSQMASAGLRKKQF